MAFSYHWNHTEKAWWRACGSQPLPPMLPVPLNRGRVMISPVSYLPLPTLHPMPLVTAEAFCSQILFQQQYNQRTLTPHPCTKFQWALQGNNAFVILLKLLLFRLLGKGTQCLCLPSLAWQDLVRFQLGSSMMPQIHLGGRLVKRWYALRCHLNVAVAEATDLFNVPAGEGQDARRRHKEITKKHFWGCLKPVSRNCFQQNQFFTDFLI